MELNYLFRKPSFPVLMNINGYFIGAKTPFKLIRKLSEIELEHDGVYDVVDIKGFSWSLYVETMTISPLTLRNRWTKLEIIKLFNERKNTSNGIKYSEKSLSSKKLDRIITDLAELS